MDVNYNINIILNGCMCAQLYSTLCNSIDYNPSGSSVHGIFQARILEWVAISYYRGSSQPRDQTHVSCIGSWILYHQAPVKPVIWMGERQN